ncbi:uncharacterized protein LOC131428824 [Malaya genurostris]|uniref:uncharacterized protein LOC131428824 n=1 Tax=Malaya genurostris TaxID=325434 RepID=UPI0026F3D166|nr:uncharacterized protein LOC131428824 [Malaya genurostris]
MQRTPVKTSEEESIFIGFEDVPYSDTNSTTAKIKSLKRQRDQAMKKIMRIYESINVQHSIELCNLKVYAAKLQSAYCEYLKYHSDIVAIVPDDELEAQEIEYINFENYFDHTSAAVEARILQQPISQTAPPAQVVIHQQPLKAPIPTFDGEYTKWPKFKAMFQDEMAQSRDSDAIKLYHLDKALVGAAAGVLDAKTIHEGNYAQAWAILTERYENQRVIVETHIQGLLSLKRMNSESYRELRFLLDECINHVESLEYLNQKLTGVSELMIVYLLTAALDKATRKHWEQTLKPGELPQYRPTITFLKSQCQVLERCETACAQSSTKSAPKQQILIPMTKINNRSLTVTTNTENVNEKCDFCDASHRNYQCNILNTLSSAEKLEKVRSAGICYNCLRKGHRCNACPSPKVCQKCQKRHHTQLHDDTTNHKQESRIIIATTEPETMDLEQTTSSLENVMTNCYLNNIHAPKTVLLLTAVVLTTDRDKQVHQCRALLDSGSQANFITESMANTVGMERKCANVPISGINNVKSLAREKVEVYLQSRCSDFRATVECLVTPKVTGMIPTTNIDVTSWVIPDGIQLADPSFFKSNKIDILLGAELFFSLMKPGYIRIDDDHPELRNSHLGWLVTGAYRPTRNEEVVQYSHVASLDSVEQMIRHFWEIEEVPKAATTSPEEQRCEDNFALSHSRDNNGRFVVRLPLKENVNQLDSCRNLAMRRFFMLENRLQRNPELKVQYIDFIREYQQLGHCREVNVADDDANIKPYYLPHHAVLRPGSSSTKCRVVFDASAKSAPTHLSFNDVWLIGPVIQSDIVSIMLRFRQHPIVFSADIMKMYRQINMHPDDTHKQRIYWREHPNDPLKTLELMTVTYGTATIDEAIEAQHQLHLMLARGGFPIHKWCSNSPEVLAHIPKEERETLKPFTDHHVNNVIKVLGLLWEPSSDELLIAECAKAPTNRDPPATKRLIYSEIKIPRQVTFQGAVGYELHAFADASHVAYGACVYIQSIMNNGSVKSRLLISKSKVAPLRALTIPRKELCAALLLVRLVSKVLPALTINMQRVVLYSDSEIVLAWLKKHPYQLQTFVCNRVSEIQANSDGFSWKYIRSQHNPADIVSRGMLPCELMASELFWTGGTCINSPVVSFGVVNEVLDENLPELKANIAATPALIEEQLEIFETCSSFRRLQRIIAWVLRFLSNARKSKENRITIRHLSVQELRRSTIVIVRVIQHIELQDEIQRMKTNTPCKRIGALNPIYNYDDVLRVGGRLKHSNLSDKSKHQLILPNANPVTHRLIREMHHEHLHVGPAGLLSAIRQQLLRARPTIRQVTRSCTNPTGVSQLMGDLPKQRVTPAPVFNITGVDYAGPILVKQGTHRPKVVKAYIAVFVCMATKAVHLELVSDLTCDAFLAALQRFAHPNSAAVKSTKTHLKRVIGINTLTFEEMTTIRCEIEAVLNSRPLFAISGDPTDPEVISPAHFLIGRSMTAVPEPTYQDIKFSRLSRWQHLQLLREQFWRAWSRHYLSSLQPRKKNWNTTSNVRTGMIVLLQDKNRPPLQWKLGRITNVYPGPDNLVRVVDSFSEGKTFSRSISKLSVLSIEENQGQGDQQ